MIKIAEPWGVKMSSKPKDTGFILTSKERLEILEEAKKILLTTGSGLCYAMGEGCRRVTGFSPKTRDYFETYFPEILKYRPKGKGAPGAFWWSTRRKRKRIRVINKVIKEIKS